MLIKDAQPLVGIFSLVNNKIYVLQESIDNLTPVAGIYDAGKLFHIDLLKMIPDLDPSIDDELKKKLKSVNNPFDYPRGRITYNINTDEYSIFTCMEIAKDSRFLTTIKREFHLPENKTMIYIDPYYKYDGE